MSTLQISPDEILTHLEAHYRKAWLFPVSGTLDCVMFPRKKVLLHEI